jgi:hypothetical protein
MSIVLAILGSKIGRGALIGLGVLIALWLWGQKKEREGYAACKVEWDAAVDRATEQGSQARSDAESDVAADPDGKLHNDPYNRDR